MTDSESNRRSFVRSALASVAVGMGARHTGASPSGGPGEPWLAGLDGTHRQFFDVGNLADAKPLNRVGNFLSAYASAYQISELSINALFGAHGQALAFVCSDRLWSHYRLGELNNIHDHSGEPASRNVYFGGDAVQLPAGLRTDSTVPALMKRGVRFLACNNSIETLAQTLAGRGFGTQTTIHDDIVSGLLPGVMTVPAMAVAGNRAQESGFTYAFIS